MTNATDNLIEAEKMIRSTIRSPVNDVEICRWLFEFNKIEKGFTIKCYRTEIPDISFCIEKSGGKSGWFFRIRKDQFLFRPIKGYEKYFKRQSDTDAAYILYSNIDKPGIDILKKHIFESYEWQLNKLRLVSNVSSINNASLQNPYPLEINSYYPTKEDVDAAELILRETSSGEVTNIEAVINQLEKKFEEDGKPLKENWRDITKRNIPIWFSKN